MESKEQEVKVFSGTAKDAENLRSILEKHSIPTQIRDEIGNKEVKGLRGTPPASVNLFVNNSNIRRADPLIKDFMSGISR